MKPTRRLSIQKTCVFLSFSALVACGGSSSSSSSSSSSASSSTPSNSPSVTTKKQIYSKHYFRDRDVSIGEIGGELVLAQANNANDQVNSVRLYWADYMGDIVGDSWLSANASSDFKIVIPLDTKIPDDTASFLMFEINEKGDEGESSLIKFHDFKGNAQVSGPGGISDSLNNSLEDHPGPGDGVTRDGAWYYGGLSVNDRDKIYAYRTEVGGGVCVFDNGLVAVNDMENQSDPDGKILVNAGHSNIVNDVDYPPFSFLCDADNPVNVSFEVPRVKDGYGAWTYSILNDSMFYGTHVYDTYTKYLGEPPLEEKIRLRTHFDRERSSTGVPVAYWDGAYANLTGVMDSNKMTTLDLIAHEVGHGVLSRISHLKAYDNELNQVARTLHEAFSDMSAVVAKYEFTGELHWIHGEETRGRVRYLNKIKTESTAITSYLDYADAGENYYLSIGMITYPFYLLTAKWGVEKTYNVMIGAARNCWLSTSTLLHAANCIKQSAIDNELSESDVIEAFKAVKIKLFDEGVLSHFTFNATNLNVDFMNSSQSTGTVETWLWTFGDGQTSNLANPSHTYATGGNYQVTLKVSDSTGDQDSYERQITVSE